ncbi:gfo/Idh/MocA family oxidoreductase [Clostridiaceae bacterium]|nr:gfo/Idh/MocA family oxidoreductase [Clostridiaceae bacterium]
MASRGECSAMKALVIGYGSMGRRRIRLLQEIMGKVDIVCVDSRADRLRQIQEAGFTGFMELNQAIEEKPDVAFVCAPPGSHAGIIISLTEAGIHVFTELNLTDDGYEEIKRKAALHNVTVFMSSTMLYKRQTDIIGRLVKKQTKPLAYLYHVGQYLPDWHPWESYKDFFVGKKETNGVREIFAVQLPWLVEAFGRIASLSSCKQRCTDLEIAFDDCIAVCFRHENGTLGVFAADVVSRKAASRLEIIGEDLHLIWEGGNDLSILDLSTGQWEAVSAYKSTEHIDGYADHITEDPYRDEIRDFLKAVYQGGSPRYSLDKDAYILSLIDKIEGIR